LKNGRKIDRPAGDDKVPEYRAYIVGQDGHFRGFEGFACRDDADAVAKAERLIDGHDIELWSGERFIVRLSPKPSSQSAS
jgi:hypothetical protein